MCSPEGQPYYVAASRRSPPMSSASSSSVAAVAAATTTSTVFGAGQAIKRGPILWSPATATTTTTRRSSPNMMDLTTRVRLVTVALALQLVATSITMPHQQAQRDSLGCDSLCLGSLTSARSTVTLLGAALVGRLSDSQQHWVQRVGPRKLFLWMGGAATAGHLLLMQRATTIQDLGLALLPLILQQNMSVSKAVLAEYYQQCRASVAQRAQGSGVVGMAAGLSMMLGPLAGVTLLSDYAQATTAGLICVGIGMAVVALLPAPPITAENVPDATLVAAATTATSTHQRRRFWQALDVPSARTPASLFLLTNRLFSTLSFHIYQTILTVSLNQRFHFGPTDYGRFFSMVGLFLALSQGVFAPFVLRHLVTTPAGKVRLLLLCIAVVISQRYWAFCTDNVTLLHVLFATMTIAIGLMSTIYNADTTQVVDTADVGSFYGVVTVVESGAGMLGPVLGGSLAAYVHPVRAPLWAALGLNVMTFVMVAFGYQRIVLGQIEDQSKKER